MNLQNGRGSVSTASSSGAWKSGETVPDQFPAGLRVLVVDDDPTCLMILEKMLRTCLYEVTKCNRAEIALSLLRENKNGYDVVISDVHMPDMDGFKLLEYIGLEMDLPVIMMSADDGKSVVMKGVTHGACDYLIKPVRIEALKNIWQHVVRKKKNEWKDVEQSEMNLQNGRGSVSMASSSGAWKSGETVPDQFPAGLRVLVVDDDPTCLMVLEKMLRTCLYEVMKCNRAEIALSLLRENKNGYDVVISDVHMPDMDGFKLLEYIGLEMDLPVIMMSADDGKSVVMKGVTHGACDYLIKPVRIEALKNIWQHVVRKKKNEWKDVEQSGSVDEGYRQQKPCEEPDYSSSANEGNWKNSKKRKDEDEDAEDRDDTSTLKKPRVVWSVELHQQFVGAVNQLGIDKAVPKKILELMNVPGLTRENVASHLQKYRLYLRRLSGVSQHLSNLSNSFISSQEASFGAVSSLNGIDLQTLAATGQLPAQSLATLQAAGLGRSTAKSGIPMPLVDQRNLFSFENPKLRFAEGQQHHSSGKPMNLLHGIPTTMEAKQLANLHQSAQSLGAVNMQVNPHGVQNSSLYMIGQPQSRGQIMNESTGTHVPRLPSSIGQPMVSNGIPTGVIGRNGISDGGRGTGYNPVPQNSSMLNFPLNNTPELTGNSYTLGSTQGVRAKTCNATCNLAQGHESSPWLVACVQSGSFVISIFLVFILFSLALLGFLMFSSAK